MASDRPKKIFLGWKRLSVALLLIFTGLVIYGFLNRTAPINVKGIDLPPNPKPMRPVRKNAPRTEQARKITAKVDGKSDAVKSSRCVKRDDFDPATRIRRQEVDDNCDGVIDYCYVEELNEYGEDIRHRFYKNCGSEMHICTETERNEYGEVISSTVDLDCDGRPDVCETYKRNDHGDIIEETDDRGCDGVLGDKEPHWCSHYDYDADGLIVQKQEGRCGEKPRHCSSFQYDLAAGIQRQKTDHDCDGTVDVCREQIFTDGRDDNDYDLFIEKECSGRWDWCNVKSDKGDVVTSITGHKACAKRYNDLVNRNRGKRR